MREQFIRFILISSFLILLWASLIALLNDRVPKAVASKSPSNGSQVIYLPFIQNHATFGSNVRRVNATYFDTEVWFGDMSIFWFGKVNATDNYADVRVGYNHTHLYVRVLIFDRRIWCNTNPQASNPTLWDTIELYLALNGNSGSTPDTKSFRLVGPFDGGVVCVDGVWPTAYRGNGTNWVPQNISFTADNFYRGLAGPNQNGDNDGWTITFQIPFASLGLSGAPAQGTAWGLGMMLYDRDDAGGTPIAIKLWPETFVGDKPATWGQLVFGLPSTFTAPPATPRSTVTIRHGLNGIIVKDGDVGGGFTCGSSIDRWNQWGETNYAGRTQINIQNQEDAADWPCFSKYYLTFPLNSLPSGKVIISSTLTLYQFGNSGQGWNPGPLPSLIQVYTVSDDWNEGTLTWNNAPLAFEYVNRSYVDPLDYIPPWPGIPRTWDVSRAVAKAYAAGQPLRLVLYSADSPMHSGKYFFSSDADLAGRPMLQVLWGDP